MRPEDEDYFESLEAGLDEAFDVAERAKRRGEDPKPEVEIPVAKDMADRVENILGIDGVAERVRDLEGEMSREEAALELVEDFVEGRVGDYETKAGKVEGAVRTAVALLTEGVVAAPIEGIDRVEVNANDDGTEYVAVYYAGPIRSAGGTAQALSVLVADYARALLDIDRFKPRDDEIERYAEEVDLYDSETGLQYSPKDKETKFITEHCPVMLDGEATGDEEVDGFRDLERIATNSARGGMCLVLAEGIALKAPKIQRYTRNLEEVEWPWLQDLIDGTIGKDDSEGDDDNSDDAADEAEVSTDADDASDEPEGPPRVDPSNKFLRDLIAGRPVFGHPSNEGGFRLRYGRSRNHGFATAGIHPATMHLVDDFLATGTQIKTERPGKAAGIVPVDSIEGPTVKLANGDVRRIDDPEEALEVRNGVVEILDVGEYLVNYGEFVENNHELAPASYAPEWWIQDFEAAGADVQALRDSPYVDLEAPDADQALEWATEYDAPLHPAYTYLWHDIEVADFEALADAVANARTEAGDLVLNNEDAVREPLEALLVEHRQDDDEIRIPDWLPLVRSLGVTEDLSREWDDLSADAREWPNALAAVNEVAPFEVRERAPTRIGNRMGRPEKSESRDLSPAVHTLFPIGEAGGSQRDVSEAARYAPDMKDTPGKLDVQLGVRECPSCGDHTFEPRCGDCGEWTDPHYECPDCNVSAEPDESGRVECPRCERELDNVAVQTVDVGAEYRDALQAVGERENAFDQLKGVKGLSSAEKVPEPMEKGVLRAKHDVSTFKDGTVRYDMTDLPVTSVKPSELDVTVEHFRELGYEEDIHGDPLEHDDQLVELRVQDVVLSDGAAEHMLQTADFVDDLLTQYYGLDPFYELEERDDLVGELVFGMAPHTSAAVVGRVIGFTSASVGYAHPYFHAAKRRNCDGDEDCVMLLMDGLINFSKSYLPDQRGGSVAEDSRLVAVDPDGDVRFLTFDEFWDELEAPIETDGKFRKRTCYSEGWQTYAFDDNHEASLEPIEKAIRYQADDDDQLVRVETQFGRSLEITEHHSLFRYDDGIEEVAGADLEAGDLVVAPRDLDVDTRETTLDVTDCVDDPYVVIDDDVEELLRTAWESTDRGSETHGAFNAGLAYRLNKSKIGFERFQQILAHSELDVPTDIEVGLEGSSLGITRTIEVDEDFAWLLGLFVAEGTTSSVNPCIHNADEDLIDRAADIATDKLGTEPGRRWSNRAYELRFPAVFREVLYSLGFENADSYDSSEKVVPECILHAPRSVVLDFLRGFIAGDGSDSSNDNVTTVSFHTTSDDVKDGIMFLLHRLGLVANVSTKTNRDGNRQDIHTVTVSGGANDNPLHRLLDGDDPYLPKSLVVSIPSTLMELREMDIAGVKQTIPKYLKRRDNISLEKLTEIVDTLDEQELPSQAEAVLEELRPLVDGDLSYLRVKDIESVDYDGYLYDLQVGGDPVFTANWLYAHNSMDAPLVMSSRIDPSEIDDEAHNMDVVSQYPREFYEATRELADPGEVEDLVEIAEESLGTDTEYAGFEHTHDTSDIHLGPSLSAYKTLGSMMDKMDAQLELARKLRAVDETDVAERVIEYHFLPDLIGNLRAFSRQETRCLDCGEKYRRMPLTGDCRECGGRVNLTVHEGSVNKYMDTAITVAEEYDCREYTKQRLEVLQNSLESIFENDKNKQSGIADFM
ncbi:DNA-directed DNA polymerase D large subunit (intein-containing) [Halobacterium hubeiense]|uniref:DNA polymerase II large subunit n=1 Tax=Halobacterium hubeiense TaxID=1407499 RepID=A0A0U5H3K4_9EURY|nr:DNA polymerase II large subunit [Halobacterium hubeiense]CQH61752.1 DNA-directed DNA polymerase D large subunit (intein-containing) [Halobacterium hubeiense]